MTIRFIFTHPVYFQKSLRLLLGTGVTSCEEPGLHMSRPVKFPGRSCSTPSNREKVIRESESYMSLCFSGGGSSFLLTPVLEGVASYSLIYSGCCMDCYDLLWTFGVNNALKFNLEYFQYFCVLSHTFAYYVYFWTLLHTFVILCILKKNFFFI